MARGSPQASGAAGQSNANANAFMGNANQLYGNLAPQLESQAANPQGFSPGDESSMETGAMQTAGGSQAGAVGQGGLLAARTRNAGAGANAISDASRGAGETLSRGLLGIRNANASLKQHQKDSAQSGLEGLTGLETGASNNALGNVSGLVNADTSAAHQSWDGFNDITGSVINAANAASKFKALGG